MKISKEIIDVLKNFSLINKSIMIYKGDKIRTISENRSVFAEYKLSSEKFEKDFGIYSIPEFLSILSLFEEPEIEFFDTYMKIFSGDNPTSVSYVYASENVIITPGRDKSIKFPDSSLDFTLTSDNLSLMKKATGILKSDELSISFTEGEEKANLKLSKGENSGSSKFDLKVDLDFIPEKDLSFKVNSNHLIFMQDDYKVSCSEKKIIRFSTPDSRLTYFIPTLRG